MLRNPPTLMTAILFFLFEQHISAIHLICMPYPSNAGQVLTFDLSETEAKAKVVQSIVHIQEINV